MLILTPRGDEIDLPEATFRKLRSGGFLIWNAARGLRQLRPSIYVWTEVLRGPDPTRPRPLRAHSYCGQQYSRPSESLGDILKSERRFCITGFGD
jgi:hypothetical protein